MATELRPYQIDAIKNIFSKWREGRKSILFQMPTGTGKTVLFSEIVRLGFEKQRKILIVVHRIELVEQITKKLHEVGVIVGHIIAGKESDYSKIIQVASIQTLSRREHPNADLIIIDECHHAKAESYRELWEIYKEAKFLGVTATPIRLSGEGFDDLFDELLISWPISKFISEKYLVPITHYVGAKPNLDSVKVRQGDYVTKILSDIMMDNSLMSDLVESYKERANGKSTIIFAVDVEHSKGIVERYLQEGISAAHIDAKTPRAERDKILTDFKKGNLKIVSNVEIITEGFDFPECEAVQLARPTKSLSLYLQMVGRVMRIADGKKEGIVLDNAGLWLEHGLVEIDREWSLEGKKKNKYKEIQSREVAIDDEGTIREVNRTKPNEIKGLKLIPLTTELKRLLEFESILTRSRMKDYNLLSAYYKYMELLEDKEPPISREEFEYIKKRLNYFNETLPEERKFRKGFWFVEQKKLFN